MGADLEPRPEGATAPRFALFASQDPGTALHPGTGLERVQILKGWLGPDGGIHQAVHDLATSRDTSDGIDLDSCESPPGSRQLCGVWTDPDFDVRRRAVYYARVVERPTCRYSWRDCLRLPEGERPETCRAPEIPRTIRERAWTSPIWYTP